ncbi:uncharacterized protein LOC142233179 [Haematobia irritans]|uniref:uncharacterized protein LOC142233179 n=1 Tax=Haematobia irritans TaxID=7368 RepID=UPI003F4FE1FC
MMTILQTSLLLLIANFQINQALEVRDYCKSHGFGYKVKNPHDCHGFYVCLSILGGFSLDCGHDYYFNETLQHCVKGECPSDLVIPDTLLEQSLKLNNNSQFQMGTSSQDHQTNTTDLGKLSTMFTSKNQICYNVTDGNFIRDPKHCNVYYICYRHQPHTRQCPGNLYFDPTLRRCNLPELVNCETDNYIQIHQTNVSTERSPVEIGEPFKDFEFSKINISFDFINNTNRNEIRNLTQLQKNHSNTQIHPTKRSPIEIGDDSKDTDHSKTDIILDNQLRPIGLINKTNDKGIESKKEFHIISNPFINSNSSRICRNESNWNFIRNPQDCGKYYICHHREAYEYTCPGDFYFDAQLKKCTFRELVSCDLHNDDKSSIKFSDTTDGISTNVNRSNGTPNNVSTTDKQEPIYVVHFNSFPNSTKTMSRKVPIDHMPLSKSDLNEDNGVISIVTITIRNSGDTRPESTRNPQITSEVSINPAQTTHVPPEEITSSLSETITSCPSRSASFTNFPQTTSPPPQDTTWTLSETTTNPNSSMESSTVLPKETTLMTHTTTQGITISTVNPTESTTVVTEDSTITRSTVMTTVLSTTTTNPSITEETVTSPSSTEIHTSTMINSTTKPTSYTQQLEILSLRADVSSTMATDTTFDLSTSSEVPTETTTTTETTTELASTTEDLNETQPTSITISDFSTTTATETTSDLSTTTESQTSSETTTEFAHTTEDLKETGTTSITTTEFSTTIGIKTTSDLSTTMVSPTTTENLRETETASMTTSEFSTTIAIETTSDLSTTTESQTSSETTTEFAHTTEDLKETGTTSITTTEFSTTIGIKTTSDLSTTMVSPTTTENLRETETTSLTTEFSTTIAIETTSDLSTTMVSTTEGLKETETTSITETTTELSSTTGEQITTEETQTTSTRFSTTMATETTPELTTMASQTPTEDTNVSTDLSTTTLCSTTTKNCNEIPTTTITTVHKTTTLQLVSTTSTMACVLTTTTCRPSQLEINHNDNNLRSLCGNHVSGDFIADPNNCKNYFTCYRNETYSQTCPGELYFDAILKMCNYRYLVKCPEETLKIAKRTVDTEVMSVEGCHLMADGTFVRDPSNCNIYYECHHGKGIKMKCPRGQYFDRINCVCNYKSLIHDCEN